MKATARERFKYAFDNFMARGGLSIFLALLTLSVAAFLLMSAVRLLVNAILPDESIQGLTDQLWRVFLQISDAGAVAEDGDSSLANKVAGITTIFIGLVLFSSLVAFITSQFEARLTALKKGRSQVVESRHTLILGYTDRLVEIAREIIVANESEKDAAIVVLADRDKEQMDDDLRDKLSDRGTTRIVTRSGAVSTLLSLRKASAMSARSIIVLNPAGPAASAADQQTGDAIVLKAVMAVAAACAEQGPPQIVAELRMAQNRKLAESIAPGRVHTIDEDEVLAKIMVQTSRISGLAIVYSNLVGFVGNEVYFFDSPESTAVSYEQMQMSFQECSLLGYRRGDGIVLNPSASATIEPGDQLILLAEDDSTIRYRKNAVGKLSAQIPDQRLAVEPEKELIVGWNARAPIIITEYARYLKAGSAIDVVVPEIDDDLRREIARIRQDHPDLALRLLRADVHVPGTIEKITPEQYDNVILLSAESNNAEEMDAHTIAGLLEFRAYFRGKTVKTQLITEVKDSDNTEIIMETGVKDFLVSNQFVSKIYAQVSESPDVLEVYHDLFSPDGSEVYIKPATCYGEPGEYTFGDLVRRASLRGETCFGIKLKAAEMDADANYGVILNPHKNERVVLGPEDSLIVLAEDET